MLASGAGSGTHEYPYLIDPLSALQARSIKDHTSIRWILDPYAYDEIVATATGADAAVVVSTSKPRWYYLERSGRERSEEVACSKSSTSLIFLHLLQFINEDAGEGLDRLAKSFSLSGYLSSH